MEKNKTNKLYAPSSMVRTKGFTLIEFLVVLSIIVFIIPSLFGLMYALLRQQSRIIALQDVKRQGDLVFNHMKTTLKNKANVPYSDLGTTPKCTSSTAPNNTYSSTSLYFSDASRVNGYSGYRLNGTRLDYEQSGLSTTQLTSSGVRVDSFTIGCVKDSDYSPALINATFTISQSANNVSLTYNALIKLKSH